VSRAGVHGLLVVNCTCHDYPMILYRDGRYRCRVKRRESVRRHEERSFVYRTKKDLYNRRLKALNRRRNRKERDGEV